MPSTAASVPTSTTESSVAPLLAWLFALAALWALPAWRMSYVWDTSDQYSHGWFVPLLAAWVFWNRWSTRPVPMPAGGAARIAWAGLLLLCVFVLGPAHLVLESSADWRMAMHAMALAAFAGSLALTALAGGAPWVRHFAFVFLFALVAVPWPYDFERWLTVELSMLAARVTAALFNFAGLLAVCEGNTIEMEAGVLGVEDACSGVRSFQSSLMVALLLGEWFMFRPFWRVMLCLAGLAASYVFNIARMLVLGFAAASSGTDAIARWHDPAGYAILAATLGFLWLLSLALRLFPVTSRGEAPLVAAGARLPRERSLVPIAALAAGSTLLAAGATEAWYQYRESDRAPNVVWTIAPSGDMPDESLGANIEQGLGYDEGFRRRWHDAHRRAWELIYMRWDPGRTAASAGPHAPDWCQRALGRTVIAKSPVRLARVGSVELPYQVYTIEDGARTFHLFLTIDDGWRGGDWLRAGLMGDGSHRARRLRQVLEGRRNLGQISLQLALTGEKDTEAAESQMLEILPSLIAPQS